MHVLVMFGQKSNATTTKAPIYHDKENLDPSSCNPITIMFAYIAEILVEGHFTCVQVFPCKT